MKITEDVISKFFGNGKGFTMTSIKRWGGFIKNEDELDETYFLSVIRAISAKDREVEFVDEVHMVNYLMRTCYWCWCQTVKAKLRLPIVLESQLVSNDSTDELTPIIRLKEPISSDEPVVDPKWLHQVSKEIVIDQLGEKHGMTFQLYYVEEMEVKEIAKLLNVSGEMIRQRIKSIKRLLSSRLSNLAQREYQIKLTAA